MVHCSKEFVPCSIYVAISRVRHPDDIQVCKFKRDQLLKPPNEAIHFCQQSPEESPDYTCCVNRDLNIDMFKVSDIGNDFGEEDGDAQESMPVDDYPDGLVAFYFEREDDKIFVELGDVFLDLEESENELSRPPDYFDICQVLRSQAVPETAFTNDFCTAKNAVIAKVLSDSVPQLKLFSLILWY